MSRSCKIDQNATLEGPNFLTSPYDDIESQKVEKIKKSYVRVHFRPKKVI